MSLSINLVEVILAPLNIRVQASKLPLAVNLAVIVGVVAVGVPLDGDLGQGGVVVLMEPLNRVTPLPAAPRPPRAPRKGGGTFCVRAASIRPVDHVDAAAAAGRHDAAAGAPRGWHSEYHSEPSR